MKLEKKMTFFFLSVFCILVFALFLLLKTIQSFYQLERINERHFASYKLAEEVRRSSDDLTRMGRTYVITGDARYKQYFEYILKIRDGKIPRPEAYDEIFWDFITAEHNYQDIAQDHQASLLQLMKTLGFHKDELRALSVAKARSDELVGLEVEAFNAMSGLFKDAQGQYTIKDKPDREMAINLLHGEKYHKEKAHIMEMVNEFYHLLDGRTKSEKSNVDLRLKKLFNLEIVISVFTLIFIFSSWFYARQLFSPIRQLSDFIKEVRETGVLSCRLPIKREDEVGIAGKSLNEMLEHQQKVLTSVCEVMKGVSVGDFSKRVTLDVNGDFVTLKEGTNQMADNLVGIVDNVRKSCIQLSSSAVNISATTKEQAASAREQEATNNEIMGTSQHIAQTARELVTNMDEVARAVDDTSGLAEHGHQSLSRMRSTVEQMMSASRDISDKLTVLSEKASKINTVVTTINKIADQTNLLSVNAAIEADKAGEYGVGFSTVATEIRRLADQTSVATYDIDEMVKEMQSAVSAGVMGMDTFSDKICQGVEDTRQVGDQLSQIVEKVQALAPHFESVHQGMRSQSDGAEQIQEALTQMSETIRNFNDSMRMSNTVVDALNQESDRLQQSVSVFRIENGN